MRERRYDEVLLCVFGGREEMGRTAASAAATALRGALAAKGEANAIFAAAPSQNEVLAALVAEAGIDWDQVNAFHLDEYVGLPPEDRRSFNAYLDNAVFGKVPFKSVNRILGMADPAAECARYEGLLRSHPADLVILGIGENGHIAFNDPPVADFADPALVKTVELETACRQQQVNDGCFPSLDAVPTHAITLTIPAITAARRLFCVVPGPRKANALRDALQGPVSVSCPASVLRKCPGAAIYADEAAAGLLK